MLPRRRTVTLLLLLCLGHVLLISAQVPSRSEAGTSVLGAATFGSVARLQGGIAWVSGGFRGWWSRYWALSGAARENEALRARVLELEGQLQGERARAARVGALEEALALQQSVVAPTIAARVIAGSPVPGVLTITVDRGTADGVLANMAVINAQGVVGRVIGSPSGHAASVQLLVDHAATAGARLEASGTDAAVSGGFADGYLRVGLLSSAAPVAVGERVLTSGQDGIYPAGFLIGIVKEINGAGKAREVVVEPAVRFDRLDVVLVVLAKAGGGDLDP
jgi:rod shape-determining protein MreC